MITPIILPVHSSSDPKKCKHCRRPLEIVEACAACKEPVHDKDNDISVFEWILFVFILLCFATVGMVILGLWANFIMMPIFDFIFGF